MPFQPTNGLPEKVISDSKRYGMRSHTKNLSGHWCVCVVSVAVKQLLLLHFSQKISLQTRMQTNGLNILNVIDYILLKQIQTNITIIYNFSKKIEQRYLLNLSFLSFIASSSLWSNTSEILQVCKITDE